MSPGDFLIICAASFLATYAHLVFALIADKIGMVKLDFGKGLSMLLFGEAYEGKPPYALGLIAVHLNGIIFGLMYATVGAGYICGPPVFRGPGVGRGAFDFLAMRVQSAHHGPWLFQPQDAPQSMADRAHCSRHLRRRARLALSDTLKSRRSRGFLILPSFEQHRGT